MPKDKADRSKAERVDDAIAALAEAVADYNADRQPPLQGDALKTRISLALRAHEVVPMREAFGMADAAFTSVSITDDRMTFAGSEGMAEPWRTKSQPAAV